MDVFVTQAELEEIAIHEREIAWRNKRVEELKSNIQVLLHGGAGVEPGRFGVKLDKRFGRTPAWKQCVIDNLGHDFAEDFRKQYPVHIFFEVRVTEHAIPPMWRGHEDSWNSEN